MTANFKFGESNEKTPVVSQENKEGLQVSAQVSVPLLEEVSPLQQSIRAVIENTKQREKERKKYGESIEDITKARESDYGGLNNVSYVARKLKLLFRELGYETHFSDVQVEGTDMILHKFARLISGNPNNVDSWNDIAGYASKIADYTEKRNS